MLVVIPIEVYKREIDSKLLLALFAASKGFSVVLGAKSETLHYVRVNRIRGPGIFHHKGLSIAPAKVDEMRDLSALGWTQTVSEEETGTLEECYSGYARYRFNDESLRYVSRVYCWGTRDFNWLCENYPYRRSIFLCSGSPRVDIWKIHGDRISRNLPSRTGKARRKKVIFVSNFSLVFGVDDFATQLEKFCSSQSTLRDHAQNYLEQYAEWQYGTIGRWLQVLRQLSDQFADVDFELRPHPVERKSVWENLFLNTRVRVTNEKTFIEALDSDSLVVHSGCTCGIEAFLTPVPCVAFLPLGAWHDTSFPCTISKITKTNLELFSLIESFANGNSQKITEFASKSLFAMRIHAGGGLNAENIAEDWWHIAQEGGVRSNFTTIARFISPVAVVKKYLTQFGKIPLYYWMHFTKKGSRSMRNRAELTSAKMGTYDGETIYQRLDLVFSTIRLPHRREDYEITRIGPMSLFVRVRK